jgi:WD40 repeat protein
VRVVSATRPSQGATLGRATLTQGCTVFGMAFSPDGQTLAAGDSNDKVVLWDTATGERRAALAAGDVVGSVTFSTDGQTLAARGQQRRRRPVGHRHRKTARGPR